MAITSTARVGRRFRALCHEPAARLGAWAASALARFAPSRIDAALRGNLLIAMVVVLGLALSTACFFATRYHYLMSARQAFQGPATRYATTVSKGIHGYLEMIIPIGTYFSASKDVKRWEFLAFAKESLPRYPAIRALQWVPRVRAGERARYEKEAVADGLYGFRITERSKQGGLVAAGDRPDYFPVYFVEPFKGNEAMLGFDLASDPARLEDLEEARDAGRMIATARVPVTTPAGREPSILLILPIYRQGAAHDTVKERRQALLGYVVGDVRVGAMLETALTEQVMTVGLDLYLVDNGAPAGDRLLYFRPSPSHNETAEPLPVNALYKGLFSAVTEDVAGRSWSIVVKPVSGHFHTPGNIAPWAVAAVGLLLMALLVQHLIAVRRRTAIIEQSVAERTMELSTSNAALKVEMAERQRAEQEMRTAKDQAEVASQAKSQFLAMVSHELRTPLNAIIGFSEILSEETFGPLGQERYRGYAKDILYSGRHLLSLINDILDLSKIEANETSLREVEVDVGETVRAALRFVQDKIISSGLQLRLDLAPDLPRLYADERAVTQILVNLLSNAVKFTLRGGRIRVSAHLDAEGGLVLAVADTGIGIAEQHLAMVLLPFNQVDSSLSRKYEGTGLGLPLSKALAEQHGGSLSIESEERRGTMVTVRFPKERMIRPRGRPVLVAAGGR